MSPTLGDFLRDEWLPAVRAKIRPTTYVGYEGHVRRYLVPALGDKPLDEITPSDLNHLYARLLAKLRPATVRAIHATARSALRDAVKWGSLDRNPAERADPPRQAHPEMTVWTAAELTTFLEKVRDHSLYPLWLTLAMTGLRRGEALGLRWSDVDLETRQLRVRQTVLQAGGQVIIGRPKTTRGRRVVVIDRGTADVLAGMPRFGELIFCHPDGRNLHPGEVTRTFLTLVDASGLPRIRLHDLRHTHATLALQAGVHPKIVSERLGHSSIAFTLEVYSHALPSLQEEAAVRIANLVGVDFTF